MTKAPFGQELELFKHYLKRPAFAFQDKYCKFEFLSPLFNSQRIKFFGMEKPTIKKYESFSALKSSKKTVISAKADSRSKKDFEEVIKTLRENLIPKPSR